MVTYYQVAGLNFCIDTDDVELENRMFSYCPFRHNSEVKEVLFSLEIQKKAFYYKAVKEIGFFSADTADFKVIQTEDGYVFHISIPGGAECCVLKTNALFSSGFVEMKGDIEDRFFALDNCIMLLYAFSGAKENVLLIHASVVINQEKGYLFIARSGTGKSTHSRLWLRYVSGTRLLNDDNPILRIESGNVCVYGSPWSGKTHCYINERVDVGAIVRLRQEKENKINKVLGIRAFASLLSACSAMPWDRFTYDLICKTVEEVASKINIYILGCRPDKESALLCNKTISNGK